MSDGDTGMSGAGNPRPPARVRVTGAPADVPAGTAAARAARPPLAAATRGLALPDARVWEADALYARSLIRTQLRLALGCLLGLLVAAGTLTVAIFAVSALADPAVFGVPLSWLLQAYAYYPLGVFFAIAFARGAARNERRYRALAGTDAGTGTSTGAGTESAP